MADNIFGDSKNKVIETENFTIRGHLLRWFDTAIQISNISMVSTADLPLPRFPVWTVAGVFLGLAVMSTGDSTAQGIGLVILIVAGGWMALWYNAVKDAKSKKHLHLFLNSGNVYSFVFSDRQFLAQILQLLANIIETGTTPNTNFNVNIHDCNVTDSQGNLVNIFLR